MRLRAITNGIIFKFVEEFSKNQFTLTTSWGFRFKSSYDEATKECRWGKVLSKGPMCSDEIKEGDFILIEPLKWTPGVMFEAENADGWIWKTDEDCVLATLPADSV